MQRYAKYFLLALVALTLSLPACGSKAIKTEGVSGTVTLDGQPLPFASIKFVPTDASGSESFGNADENGVYKLQTLLGKANAGTTPGVYKVAIECFEEVPTGKTHKDEDGNEVAETTEKSLLPAKYAKPDTSGLEVEVQKGSNTIDFELSSN